MGTMFKSILSGFMVMSLFTACGKKENNSSANNPQHHMESNQIFDYAQYSGSQVGDIAYNQLVSWLDSPDSTPLNAKGAYTHKTGSQFFSFNLGICGPGSLNILCQVPTHCFNRTAQGVMKGVPIMGGNKGLRLDGCDISQANPYLKNQDQNLREAVLGKPGRFPIRHLTKQSGAIYTVFFSTQQGSEHPSTVSQINTSLPAILNPIIIQEDLQEIRNIYLLQ
jgi:hypothetical protein